MISFDLFLTVYCLLSLAAVSSSLRILELKVPTVIDVRDTAVLVCEFDLEGDKFFSLKWYKEELEFFRYMNDYVPQMQTFYVDGINLKRKGSNISAVMLDPLEYKSSGMYRCEVSAEAPHFKVVYRHANMTVLGIPKEDPKITGVEPHYSIGSYVIANCTSPPSYPPATIEWSINGVQVARIYPVVDDDLNRQKMFKSADMLDDDFQAPPWFLDDYEMEKREKPWQLHSKTTGIKFQTDESYFQTKDGRLSLGCSAIVAHVNRSTETKSYLKTTKKEKFAQQFTNYNGKNKPEVLLLAVLVTAIHLL